jgi:hypothetical protein
MERLLLPLPTLRPAASGRINFVWPSKTASCNFCLKNKGNIYNGREIKMLATLNAYCHPDSVANVFSSLFSIFNELQGKNNRFWHSAPVLMALFLEKWFAARW